jgi:hypothetical protein
LCAPALVCVGQRASSPTFRPNATNGSSGRQSSTVGSRGARVSRRSRYGECRRWSRGSRADDVGEDVRWLWERGGGVPSSSIQHRKGRSGMLFSCSVSYRASTSEPLFRQFHNGVLGSSHLCGYIRRLSATSNPFAPSLLAHHQDRAVGVADHRIGDAAHQRPPQGS